MKKLAIITTHPIQYNAPLFRLLHERRLVEIKVFYTWSQTAAGAKYDPGFKQEIEWDIPLLEGYPFVFSENISAAPGSHHNNGIDNPNLIDEVKAWKADALLVYGWNFKSHLKLMRFFKGKIPVLFRGDSTLLDEKPGIKKLVRRIYLRYIFRAVNAALYAGSANKQYFLVHGVKEKDLYFMPHAVDNKRFAAGEETKAKAIIIRASLSIPSDAIVFLFAGKLEAKKQPLLLLDTFKAVNNKNAFLIMAGSGEQQDEIVLSAKGSERIKLLNFQNQQQMPALYAASDVFVLPSKGPNETWGLAINEAMAAGKAIISSEACGATYDLVDNGKNGFRFAPANSEGLNAAIRYFINKKDAASKMGQRSLEMIDQYDFATDAEAIEKAIAQININ